MQYDSFRAMNSTILLAASGGDNTRISTGFSDARQYIQQAEQRFTRFSEDSELSHLNRRTGEWVEVSGELFTVLQLAHDLVDETDGLFNPAILPALIAAGYDRSMDEIRRHPSSTSPVLVLERQDFRQTQLNAKAHTILLPEGMQIDLGGIAKGWIAEQAARVLSGFAQACAVSAGGDMFLVNLPPGDATWEVGLEDPFHPEQDLAVLHVLPGAVATSSIAKRHWQHNGRAAHHLIDPRSGQPAETSWLSTTVWAETAAEAEVYAKALLIGGPAFSGDLLNHSPSIAYLSVDKQGWVQGSANYHEVFHV